MDSAPSSKQDDEQLKYEKRVKLKQLNALAAPSESSKHDSSLRRHTALIKRMKQSLASDNYEHIIKEIDSLSLEKYLDEISGAAMEGIARCKTEKDTWSSVEIISALHRRFPRTFTPSIVSHLAAALVPPSRSALAAMAPEQKEKEDSARITRQRPVLRVCAELALVGIIKDAPDRSGAEWIMKSLKDLLSNDPSLASLPLLSTFLKSYSRPFLGLTPPAQNKQQQTPSTEPGTLSNDVAQNPDAFPAISKHELVEQDVRDRFKRMCEGYFENVCKKLLIEHKRLQDQDRRNHEAYIRSGEIFEDRQQAYEKMAKGYERLLSSCQTLSDLLYMPLPELPTSSYKSDSIQIGTSSSAFSNLGGEEIISGGKWEDEEERRFFEDLQDLRDFVPRSILGLEQNESEADKEEDEKDRAEKAKEEAKKLEEELEKLEANGTTSDTQGDDTEEAEDIPTPVPGTPKGGSPTGSPHLAPQGPSQLLTALLTRLPEATNRTLIDQAAVDFAFLNSKAARKRLVKFFGQVPKTRIDLLPHYSRFVATLNKVMPDIGNDLVAILDEEFRYLQRKKNVVKELAEVRLKNLTFLANLTKFRVIPTHVILHMFKVCLDDFSGTNIDNLAILLEGCGRFLLRSEDTSERFATMLELMRRKQSMQHLDQRQLLLLENAYYQCNPPERAPRQEKERTPMELFIRHLIYDVLAKKTIDKVFKLLRKLDWGDALVQRTLFKIFVKPWKIKFSSISLLAMLTYDLQRYHPAFTVSIVDQVLENLRRGLEQNVYSTNQQRVATIKYLGELYIYRIFSSGIIFETLWLLVTFGHVEGRPMPHQPCKLDMPDDFFRIRLVCTLLDTCGMCFDRGAQKKKLDNFLTFFMYYIHTKEALPMDVDFMVSDTFEAIRPKLVLPKTLEEAALAVDTMFNATYQASTGGDEEDSGDESGGESERREEEEEEEDNAGSESPVDERAPSPDDIVILSKEHEVTGPSEEEEAEFAKELAKMVTDTSAESRKVDKKTALALWDSSVLPQGVKKKRGDEAGGDAEDGETMSFTIISKRGNKQMTRQLAVPATSALAVHTRSAQLQDKVEQQHLKQLVLNYEQREEAEEMKAIEARNRNNPGMKIRYVG